MKPHAVILVASALIVLAGRQAFPAEPDPSTSWDVRTETEVHLKSRAIHRCDRVQARPDGLVCDRAGAVYLIPEAQIGYVADPVLQDRMRRLREIDAQVRQEAIAKEKAEREAAKPAPPQPVAPKAPASSGGQPRCDTRVTPYGYVKECQ